jgi:hypothetical protein
MTSLSASARLYAHVAFLRHRILLQHAANRAAVTALAILFILVGFGLLNVALFLYLRTPLGETGAVLVVAIVHLFAGGLALALSWHSHDSPELAALAETEVAALNELDSEASGAVESFEAIRHRLTHIGHNAAAAMTAVSSLQSLLSRTASQAPEKNGHENDLFDQNTSGSEKIL